MAASCISDHLDWILGKISLLKEWSDVGTGHSGGVAISGGVQKTFRCGTSGHGLVGMVVLGRWLDLILELFSNLNDSMIPSPVSLHRSPLGMGWLKSLKDPVFLLRVVSSVHDSLISKKLCESLSNVQNPCLSLPSLGGLQWKYRQEIWHEVKGMLLHLCNKNARWCIQGVEMCCIGIFV